MTDDTPKPFVLEGDDAPTIGPSLSRFDLDLLPGAEKPRRAVLAPQLTHTARVDLADDPLAGAVEDRRPTAGGDGWTERQADARAALDWFVGRTLEAARAGERLDDETAATVYAALASHRSRDVIETWVREAAGDDADEDGINAATDEAARILRQLATMDPAPEAMASGIRVDLARGEWGRKSTPRGVPNPLVHIVRADDRARLEAALPWPATLAAAVWHDRHQRTEHGIAVRKGVNVRGDHYGGTPKIIPAVSWGFGAPGEAFTEINGERFGDTPGRGLYRPRIVGITTGGAPSQRTLPLETAQPFALQVANESAQGIVTPVASKLAVIVSAVTGSGLAQASGTLGELAELLYGGAVTKARIEATADALAELATLHIVFHDGIATSLFNNDFPFDPKSAHRDHRIVLRFGAGVAPDLANDDAHRWYRGEVMLNVSGIGRLDGRSTLALRLYLLATTMWNDQHMGAAPPLTMDLDEWTRRLNAASKAAMNDKRRRNAKRDQVASAARILEDKGLAKVIIDKPGRRRAPTLRLEPTDDHNEAYRARRKARSEGGSRGGKNRG